MSLLQSFLLKLGMLAMTMGAVFWIVSQAPQTMPRPALPQQAPLAHSDLLATQSPVVDVPHSVSDTPSQSPGVAKGPQFIDLNRASVEDFEQLPGVGPVLARRVVAYRESRGRFDAVEELRGVKGIGQKKLERLRRLVTVAPPAAPEKGEKASI